MLVRVTRGPDVESVHRVHAVIADIEGPLAAWGDPRRPVVPRSAIKFVQAIPLLATGAAARFDLSDIELALACSSHSAEPPHVDGVVAWLERIGLDAAALECGPDIPLGSMAQINHHRRGDEPSAVLNCCSGKHAGFLTVARHLGVDHEGYIEPDHPVQQLVSDAIGQFTGHDVSAQAPGRDGCGIPTFAVPLDRLAAAMARLVVPAGLDDATVAAAERLVAVPNGRQFWISGTGRHEVLVGTAAPHPLVMKTGAEGVFVAAVPHRGLGLALKVEDGAVRASEQALSALLARLGELAPELVGRPVLNKAGVEVGRIEVDLGDPTFDRLP